MSSTNYITAFSHKCRTVTAADKGGVLADLMNCRPDLMNVQRESILVAIRTTNITITRA